MTQPPEDKDDATEETADEYANHAVRLSWVRDDAEARHITVAREIKNAFNGHYRIQSTEWIQFDQISAESLAKIFLDHPTLVKPITAICNIAGRAIHRDLKFKVDTYRPKLSREQARLLADYVKPFLPAEMAVPAVESVDNWFYIDKEIRSYQGRWERLITESLTSHTGRTFKKRKFSVYDDNSKKKVLFELDAALPAKANPIEVGIDVKRIGSPLDIHKRIDEIVNKADKFKKAYPAGKFGVVVYYPFESTSQAGIVSRMRSANIDGLTFAGDSPESVVESVLRLIPRLGLDVVDNTAPPSLFDQVHPDQMHPRQE